MVFWFSNGLEGPVPLMNKDNTAAAAVGNDAAKKRAEEVSSAGAVKLLTLLGALLNHKDDKKGQQDSTVIFFEYELGFTVRFPDTSNISPTQMAPQKPSYTFPSTSTFSNLFETRRKTGLGRTWSRISGLPCMIFQLSLSFACSHCTAKLLPTRTCERSVVLNKNIPMF